MGESFLMKRLNFFLIFLALAGYFAGAKQAWAQSFSLSPQAATKSAGLEFNVELNIDTGGEEVSGADIKLTFEDDILEIVKVTKGSFFPEVSHNIYAGTLYIGASFLTLGDSASGSGKLATLTLKGKSAGISDLAFVCSSQTTDTNILDTSATAKDIVDCTAIEDGSYTIVGGLGGDSGATASGTPTPVPPVSGVAWPTFLSFGLGILLMVLGLVVIF